jgi:hypothetical protein
MKYLNKLPQVSPVYIVSSEDDSMYEVIEHGEVLAHIVETIDGTRQNLYFPDGSEIHFDYHELEDIMNRYVASRTNYDMAWMWFHENEFSFLHDRGNGIIQVHVENPNKTQQCYMQISDEEIDYRAQLWRESRKG